jgi:hypothetical protein
MRLCGSRHAVAANDAGAVVGRGAARVVVATVMAADEDGMAVGVTHCNDDDDANLVFSGVSPGLSHHPM